MKNREILEKAFQEVFDEDWGNELRDFEHAFSDFYEATMKAIEIAKNERQTDIIKFGMWLCGHDKLTIEKMFNDFTKRKQRHDV